MQRGFELLAFRLAQRRARAAIYNLIQFIQIYVDLSSHRHPWVGYSRKRGVRGYPSTCLSERFGTQLLDCLPRPVV